MARDLGLLVLRLAGLYLAIAHGWGKLVGLASGQTGFVEGVAHMGFPFAIAFAWASALAEFLGGLGVAFGLFTRWAAAFAAVNMLVAALVRHHALSQLLSWLGFVKVSDDALKGWGHPELALVYLGVMLGVMLLGPGRFSIDARQGRK
jgi:putative oxidoreductase